MQCQALDGTCRARAVHGSERLSPLAWFRRFPRARVAEELARRGVVSTPTELVEGVRGLRSSEAIANFLQEQDGTPAGSDTDNSKLEGE
jgi:hypothetical protein